MYQSDLKFHLPQAINIYLGIESDFIFEKDYTEIPIPRGPDTPIIPPQPEPNVPIIDSNIGIVLCDIVQPQVIGGTLAPVLRILRFNSDLKGTHDVKFSPVSYLTLQKTDISSIQIRIVNSVGQVLPSSNNQTIAVLHFRRK